MTTPPRMKKGGIEVAMASQVHPRDGTPSMLLIQAHQQVDGVPIFKYRS